MITAIIIDDELTAIETLKWELARFDNQVKVLQCFTDPEKAIKYLNKNTVDVVFLDVEMPTMNGFEVLEHFKTRKFAVVITTAYNHYALPAIKKQCLDFLPKPMDEQAIRECIEKIKHYKKEHFVMDYLENTIATQESKKNKEKQNKITINTDGKLLFIPEQDIIYCESDGNYSTLFMENGKNFLITLKLKNLEDKLTDNFFRIHNSYIINLNKIQEYLKNDGYVILTNQVKIPVSRQKKTQFLDFFDA